LKSGKSGWRYILNGMAYRNHWDCGLQHFAYSLRIYLAIHSAVRPVSPGFPINAALRRVIQHKDPYGLAQKLP
jgi:hypothetical protein